MKEITARPFDTEAVVTNIATNVIEDFLAAGWNKVKKYFQDLDAKQSIILGEAYNKYLINTKEKNGKIKTIIYRKIPKELYSFFECTDVEYNGKRISTANISNLLALSSRIIVSGTGGIGKSILLKHLFLNTIDTTDSIPVLIELRKFNTLDVGDISLENAVFQTLYENDFALEREYYVYSMKEGGYVILLDGFDEVSREKVAKVTSEIKSLCDKYSRNKYILSSRPADGFIGWQDFTEVSACRLTKKQALSLIGKIEFDDSVKKPFLAALDNYLFEKYESFASNPLLLTIMLLTFSNHASIPDKLNDFYEEAFSTLFNMHDATKDCYVRDIRSKLGSEDFKRVFAYLCFKSYFSNEYEFSDARLRECIQKARDKFSYLAFSVDDFQEDLIQSVCMLIKDGLNYRFTHRSFQEYFAAWHTCKIPDEQQSKLLTAWIAESNDSITDEYLYMLYNMQPEKVNKIIFSPGIQKLKEYHEKNGYSLNLLETLFSGVRLHIRTIGDDKEEMGLSLMVKDQYLCNIIRSTCKCNNYAYGQRDDQFAEAERRVAGKLRNAIMDEHFGFSFKKAKELVGEDELLNALYWFELQYEYCLMILEQNSSNEYKQKKKVSSIIQEL